MKAMQLTERIASLFRSRRRRAGKGEWLHANVPRRREHPALEHWIVGVSVLVFLLVVCALFYRFHFCRNPQFQLCDLAITSGETISEGLVRQVLLDHQSREFRSGDKPGFLFGPDIEKVRDELLERAPGIRSVTITRRLPSRMEVRVVEREPVGRIGRNEQVIDAEGIIFPRNVGVDHLPMIVGLDGRKVDPGMQLDGMGLAAVRLLSTILNPECALPVAAVDVSHPDYLCLTLRDHRLVKIWWKGMDAPNGGDSRDVLARRLKRLLQAMSMAPQRQVWDATVPDDNRIFTPY